MHSPHRRRLLKRAGAAALLASPMINVGRYALASASERTYSARAVALI
jgi:hypothetical protein